MSDMTLQESIERFNEGLKKAASRARELAVAQKNNNWRTIADNLDGIRHKGRTLYQSHALSRQETLVIADRVAGSIKVD